MKLSSEQTTLVKTQEQCFDFLKQAANYEKLMPENTVKFELIQENGFLFQLKGMPEIALKLKNEQSPHHIVWEAAGGKIDFTLAVAIEKITAEETRVQFLFEGQLTAMLAMMVKKPLKKFIDTLSENLGEI